MRLSTRLALAALLIAAPALAAETGAGGPPADGLADIPVDEWTAMSAGRTLTYTIGGELWALERYEAGSNRVGLQFYDGTCLQGAWEYTNSLYCFHWEGEGTSCFRHARMGEQILILETRDGIETGALQLMSGVSDVPLSCGPEAIS
ncbi:hypothetical protein [Amaricoccus sp.]|uniref:hypothetical protein n=1 Tax=Amaricoccus sp. TaxID=1872485 RepID=UPI001B7A9107|nr:hypothetical protein [Amaricoccus sp.]MBP7242244.1 hypothetical protein [Amaricoccus sp.]